MRLPWPRGLSGLCYTFCYSFFTSYGVDETLGFHSFYLAFPLGWVLLRHELFLLQSNPYPFCGLANTFAILTRCFCHVIIWLVIARPLLGLLYTFLLLSSSGPILSLACTHAILGFLDPFHPFGAFLAHFIPLGIMARLISSGISAHSNPSFSWVFAKSFGLHRPKLPYLLLLGFIDFSTNPIYLVPSFGLFRPIFACFPFLIMPMGYYFFLRALLGLLAFFEALLLFYRHMDHHSCHLGLMVFFSIC